ncbi:hypothetical protein LTS14_008037 [Recurvomyces mirabilis]|uniref:uncharacterized protein n=1 Tax=Recurvomyces mirabilis TaxID=574656 RepID=UPI002DE16AD3|nr:hypothetical protein LTS14_008037 [Recurvomyces mirabilis]
MRPSKAQSTHSTVPVASSPLRHPIPPPPTNTTKIERDKPFKSKASVPKDSPADSRYNGAWWNPFSRTNNTAAIKSTIKQAAAGSKPSAAVAKAPAGQPSIDNGIKERKLFVPRHAGRDARLSIPISNRGDLSKIHTNIAASKRLLADRLEEEKSVRRETLLRHNTNGVAWDGGFSPTHLSGYAGGGWAPGEYLRAAREGILPGVAEEGQVGSSKDAVAAAAMAGLSLDYRDAMSVRSASSSSLSQYSTAPTTPEPKFAGRDSPIASASRARKSIHRQSLGFVTEQAIKQAYLEGFKHGTDVAPHAVAGGIDSYAQLTASRRNPMGMQQQQQQQQQQDSMRTNGRPHSMAFEQTLPMVGYEGKGKGRATEDDIGMADAAAGLPAGRPKSMIAPMPLRIAEPRQMKRSPMTDSLATSDCTHRTAVGVAGDVGTKPTSGPTYALSSTSSDPRSSISKSATEPSPPESEIGGSVATTETAHLVTPDTPLSVAAEVESKTIGPGSAMLEDVAVEFPRPNNIATVKPATIADIVHGASYTKNPEPQVEGKNSYNANPDEPGDAELAQEYESRYELESEYDWSDVEAWLQASAISVTPSRPRLW